MQYDSPKRKCLLADRSGLYGCATIPVALPLSLPAYWRGVTTSSPPPKATEGVAMSANREEHERREHRLVTPPCPRCHAAETGVQLRTDYVLYIRCPCGHVWSVPKPGVEQMGS